MSPGPEEPTWGTFRDVIRVVSYPPFLRKTSATGLLIGLALFSINHLDEVLRGEAVVGTWIKGIATCLVPFGVANWGLLVATRRQTQGSRGVRWIVQPPIERTTAVAPWSMEMTKQVIVYTHPG